MASELQALPRMRHMNDLFYWDCVVFQVEDKLFSVPRKEFIESSEIFAAMLSAPAGDGIQEGTSKAHPIYLEGYSKKDFVALLKVMYPRYRPEAPPRTEGSLQLQMHEWKSVLKLATIWVMDQYRDYAIYRLSTDFKLSPFDKITLAREHCVSTWFFEGISELANIQAEPRPIDELGAALGWETAARIAALYAYQTSKHGRYGRLTLRALKCAKLPVGNLGRECGNRLFPAPDNGNGKSVKTSLPVAAPPPPPPPPSASLYYTCRSCQSAMDVESTEVSCVSAAVKTDARVVLSSLLCPKCHNQLFPPTTLFTCAMCSGTISVYESVRINFTDGDGDGATARVLSIEEMIAEFFQREMDHYGFTAVSII